MAHIVHGSCKLAGVDHCPVVASSTSMLLKRVCLSAAIPPATHTYMLYVVTQGRNLLVGIAGMSCCQPCPVHVLTMVVVVSDDAFHPPMSTSWLFMAAVSLQYCGAGGSLVHVALSRSYTCTTQAEGTSRHVPPQTYTFLAMTTAVARAVAMGRSGSLTECRVGWSSSSGLVWKTWGIEEVN